MIFNLLLAASSLVMCINLSTWRLNAGQSRCSAARLDLWFSSSLGAGNMEATRLTLSLEPTESKGLRLLMGAISVSLSAHRCLLSPSRNRFHWLRELEDVLSL